MRERICYARLVLGRRVRDWGRRVYRFFCRELANLLVGRKPQCCARTSSLVGGASAHIGRVGSATAVVEPAARRIALCATLEILPARESISCLQSEIFVLLRPCCGV